MHKISRAYVESRFGQLHYHIAKCDAADALPPLLCLHQTPSNGTDWLPVMGPLSRERTVIAIDTPGYGMSDPSAEPATIEDFSMVMSQAMLDLAEQSVIARGQFDAMGFHTGSVIATQLATSLPHQVRRVVLFGLAAYPADLRKEKLQMLQKAFPPPGPGIEHIKKLWAIIGQLSDPRISWEERHVSMAECLRLGARMPWGYVSVYRYDFLEAMAKVTQPVLVMNPQDDLWDITNATAQIFPNGRRVDLPGVKHGVLKLETARVVAEIEAFLQQPS